MTDTFSSAQVCDATGATYRQVDYWIRRGYLHLEKPLPGSGRLRRYTFKEALQVAVMAAATNAGIHPHRVHPVTVLHNGGVHHEDWSTFTLDLTAMSENLAQRLGIS
jgi:DNA-binding transcriptional MerR regulator